MATKKQKKKWESHLYKYKSLFLKGLNNGTITTYNRELIEKLRNIYEGGIPASILLLCRNMSNGYCYDRALLMARAFLDEEDDVKLIYASIDTLKLNPRFIDSGIPTYSEHCFLERTTKDGKQLIYDTSVGLIYDKSLYWEMEHPIVRKVNDKRTIMEAVRAKECSYPENIETAKSAALIMLPLIEKFCDSTDEMYGEILRREIERFKQTINYDEVCGEADAYMKKQG